MLKFKVKKSEVNKRADIVIAGHLPGYSRSSLKQLFSRDLVFINGKPIKASHKLEPSELIRVDISLLEIEPERIEIPAIYEAKDFIVFNKPAGLLTHSKGALNTEPTVASFIANKINDPQLSGNRAGIVHRLDRATSGVIIVAKNKTALKYLQKQFSTRKVDKTYLAIVEGELKLEEAIIDVPIERNPKRPQTFRAGAGGRPAQTKYKVLKILNRSSNLFSLVELNPKTGRTHQLRVHLKYIGHPIVGDRIYGHGADNMYLYARSLNITLPGGRQMKFEAPEPKIFKDFINNG